MLIEVKIDPDCQHPKIVIITDAMSEEVTQLITQLQKSLPLVVTGFRDEIATILQPEQIYRFYSAHQKVYAVTNTGEYVVRKRLYELEEQLDATLFVRISNSDIINIRQIEQFDLSITGTICVRMKNKESTYVSRRYVSKIKQLLGM